jgi:pimeloyl-ACP methyl ester carboxylesterase
MSVTEIVKVDGGPLGYTRSGRAGGVTVLAVHSLTQHRGVWDACRASLGDMDLIAVDLRGRGASRDLPGPSSIARHVTDLECIVDALGLERIVVAGQSLGAFVALAFAVKRPEIAAGLVLVDGGLPFPEIVDVSSMLNRLEQTYASAEDYRALWRSHPAVASRWNETVERFVDADLVGSPPELRPGCRPEHAAQDLNEVAKTTEAQIAHLTTPSILLRAPRGVLDDPPGLYPRTYLQEIIARHELDMEVREVNGSNHLTILLVDPFAAQVAGAITDLSLRDAAR